MNETVRRAQPEDHVTVVVTRTVPPGSEQEFLNWVQQWIETASTFPGYAGATVLTPGTGQHDYHLIYSFMTQQQLAAWETAPERTELITAAEGFSYRARQTHSGLEAWFQLPGQNVVVPPRRWKQAALTVLGVYPLSLFFGGVLLPKLSALPWLLAVLINSILLVSLLTWLVMPNLSRAAGRWLRS